MKQQRWLIVGLGRFGVLLFVAFVGRRVSPGVANSATPGQPKSSPRRIISLAPSITEVLFALGLGDSVVGGHPFLPPSRQRPRPRMMWGATTIRTTKQSQCSSRILWSACQSMRNRENT